ncbi:MAG: hypothetical protein ACK53T_08010 [Planctomycetota bacterium]|jgi:hypothetical protein
MMNKNPTLYDLVEFRRDHIRGTFVKVATHKTNVSKAIAYSEKKKIEFLRPTTLYTRFKIVKNGSYQYKNNFK